jgi:hypothetical protein
MEQSRLRVGGWVDHLPAVSSTPASGDGRALALPSIDPVGDVTGELQLDAIDLDDDDQSYRGRRRHRASRLASPQRMALVAVLVGGLLLGVGLLSRMLLASEAEPLTAPPPVPQHTRAAPTEANVRMGVAPTAPASVPTGRADQPAPDLPGGSSSDPTQHGGSTVPGQDPALPPVIQAGYEAEDAVLGGHALTESFAGASGGQVVRLWGPGGHVEFNGVAAPAGPRSLTIHYSGGPRTIQVSINGKSMSHSLPGTADGQIGTTSLQVDLVSGGNDIRLRSSGPPVYLDGITLG